MCFKLDIQRGTHIKLHKTSGDSSVLLLPCSAFLYARLSAACTRSCECSPAVLNNVNNICCECFILSFILSLGKEPCISVWNSSVVGWGFGEGLEICAQVLVIWEKGELAPIGATIKSQGCSGQYLTAVEVSSAYLGQPAGKL